MVLLFILFVGFVVWINCVLVFYFVFWLVNMLLGLDNVFGLSGWVFWNMMFLVLIGVLLWLVVDLLVKVFYVLCVFYG